VSSGSIARRLVVVWIGVSLVLLYLPLVRFQMRLAFGVHPFLALLAAAGLVASWRALRRGWARALVFLPLTVLLVLPSTLFTGFLLGTVRGEALGPLLYRTEEEVDAAQWIARHTGREDAVLCTFPSGNFLGGRIPGRVYLGHESGTLHVDAKRRDVAAFFSGAGSLDDRARFLAAHGLTHVFVGPFERRAMPADPAGVGLEQFGEPVFRRRWVTVYRVAPGAAQR
jgi:hypothetical protein